MMNSAYDQFLAEREQWANFNRRDEMTRLLTAAVLNPGDIPREQILDFLIGAKAAHLLLPEEAYQQLASRYEPGWLASMAHLAAKDPNRDGRLEATRWLEFGRKDHTVTREDLEALRSLLLDTDQDVRAAAALSLEAMVRDDPERVSALVFGILKKLKKPDRSFVISALVPAWGSSVSPQVLECQREEFRDPRTRAQTMVSIEASIKREPPHLLGVELAWNGFLVPVVESILGGKWERGKAVADTAPLNIMGRLLALHPTSSMVSRAEAAIDRLISARDGVMAPEIIAMGPWRSFGEYAAVIWPGYADWLRRQLDKIGKSDQNHLWHLETALENLEKLSEAKAIGSVLPKRMSRFAQKALEFSAEYTKSSHGNR